MTSSNTRPNAHIPYWPLAILLSGCAVVGFYAMYYDLIGLTTTFWQSDTHYWLLSRASGIVAYLLLTFSVFFGLLLSSQAAKEYHCTKVILTLHDFLAKLGLVLILFHAFILLKDPFLHLSFENLLIPFNIDHKLVAWFAMGQLSAYIFAIIIVAYRFKKWLKQTWSRYLHPTAFIAYLLMSIHALFSGTDSQTPFMIILYVICNSIILFFTLYRSVSLLRNAS